MAALLAGQSEGLITFMVDLFEKHSVVLGDVYWQNTQLIKWLGLGLDCNGL